MLNKELISKIKGILDSNYFEKDEAGCYFQEITADYREQLEYSQILEIVNSDEPKGAFYDLFNDIEWDIYEYEYLFKLLLDEISRDYIENEDDIRDWIYNFVYFKSPYSHFENQKVFVNITVDSGDANYDYTLNNFLNYYAPNDIGKDDIEDKSSILWLVKQQGYTKDDLMNVINFDYDRSDKFLDSLNEELLNSTSSINALVFSVQMTLGELLDYLEKPSDITLDSSTSCGLVNFWNGSGSLLNISLKSKVKIPRDMAKVYLDGQQGYGISQIYGMSPSFWTNSFTAV